jgi:hypothetical protein
MARHSTRAQILVNPKSSSQYIADLGNIGGSTGNFRKSAWSAQRVNCVDWKDETKPWTGCLAYE